MGKWGELSRVNSCTFPRQPTDPSFALPVRECVIIIRRRGIRFRIPFEKSERIVKCISFVHIGTHFEIYIRADFYGEVAGFLVTKSERF